MSSDISMSSISPRLREELALVPTYLSSASFNLHDAYFCLSKSFSLGLRLRFASWVNGEIVVDLFHEYYNSYHNRCRIHTTMSDNKIDVHEDEWHMIADFINVRGD